MCGRHIIFYDLPPSHNNHQGHFRRHHKHLHIPLRYRNRTSEAHDSANSYKRLFTQLPAEPSGCTERNTADNLEKVAVDDAHNEDRQTDEAEKSGEHCQKKATCEADDPRKGLRYHCSHIIRFKFGSARRYHPRSRRAPPSQPTRAIS